MSRLRCMKVRVGSAAYSETHVRTCHQRALWTSEQTVARACRADARQKRRGARAQSERMSGLPCDASLQAAELQRRWRIATLLDHHDGDDDDLISSTRNDALPRAGFANLGNTSVLSTLLCRLWRARCLFRVANWKRERSLRELQTLRFTPCLGCSAA